MTNSQKRSGFRLIVDRCKNRLQFSGFFEQFGQFCRIYDLRFSQQFQPVNRLRRLLQRIADLCCKLRSRSRTVCLGIVRPDRRAGAQYLMADYIGLSALRQRGDGAHECACTKGVTEAGAPRALKEQLFNPGKQISSSLSQAEGRSESKLEGNAPSLPQTNSKAADHSNCVHATSESDNDFQARKAQALTDFAKLLKNTDLSTHELIWTSGDCPVCAPLNGTKYPDSWTNPPPLHHNCDCSVIVQTKAKA